MGAHADQADQLKAKINTYVNFVANGDLARMYPETADQRIRLQLDCVDTPGGEFKSIVDRAIAALREMGMRFVINVRG